jgi:hypothetical protein
MARALALAALALAAIGCYPPRAVGDSAYAVEHDTIYDGESAVGHIDLAIETDERDSEVRLFAAELNLFKDEDQPLDPTITPPTPIVLEAYERRDFDVQWRAPVASHEALCKAKVRLVFYFEASDGEVEAHVRLRSGITPPCEGLTPP